MKIIFIQYILRILIFINVKYSYQVIRNLQISLNKLAEYKEYDSIEELLNTYIFTNNNLIEAGKVEIEGFSCIKDEKQYVDKFLEQFNSKKLTLEELKLLLNKNN